MRRRFKGRLSTIDYRRLTTKKGQSLIEVLIAFTVSVVIGMALVSAGLATQRASISARNKSQATKLAQEYLEQIRLMRDVKGYATLFTTYANNSPLCYFINSSSGSDPSAWILYPPGNCAIPTTAPTWEKIPLNNTDFYRKLTFTEITAGSSKKVVVDVVWTEGVNTRTVAAETVLSKWCEGAITPLGVCP